MYDFPQKNFSMCHGTYSPIPDPSKNWSVKSYIGNLIQARAQQAISIQKMSSAKSLI